MFKNFVKNIKLNNKIYHNMGNQSIKAIGIVLNSKIIKNTSFLMNINHQIKEKLK
jgi:hypothetical protein